MEEKEIDLRDYINVLWKRKGVIISIFCITVIISIVINVRLPKQYEATASLIILPPKFKPELVPAALSVETYADLLKSDFLLEKIANKLDFAKEKITAESLKRMVSTKLIEPKIPPGLEKGSEISYAPLIKLKVKYTDPLFVKEIANIWAELFLEENRDLVSRGTGESYEFIQSQFEKTNEKLEIAEEDVKKFRNRYNFTLINQEVAIKTEKLGFYRALFQDLRFDFETQKTKLEKLKEEIMAMENKGTWIGLIDLDEEDTALELKTSSKSQLNKNQISIQETIIQAKRNLKEAQNEIQKFLEEHNIEILKDEYSKKKELLVNNKVELSNLEVLLKSTKDDLKNSNPKVQSLQKALLKVENVNDETLWKLLSFAGGYNFFQSEKIHLMEENERLEKEVKELEKVLNENEKKYARISKKLAIAQSTYDNLSDIYITVKNQAEELKQSIYFLSPKVEYVKTLTENTEAEIPSLQNIINEKELELSRLETKRASLKNTYDLFAKKAEEARISKVESVTDIKIASRAVEPKTPVGPRRRRNVMIAGFVSLFFGIFCAFFVEYLSPKNQMNFEPRFDEIDKVMKVKRKDMTELLKGDRKDY